MAAGDAHLTRQARSAHKGVPPLRRGVIVVLGAVVPVPDLAHGDLIDEDSSFALLWLLGTAVVTASVLSWLARLGGRARAASLVRAGIGSTAPAAIEYSVRSSPFEATMVATAIVLIVHELANRRTTPRRVCGCSLCCHSRAQSCVLASDEMGDRGQRRRLSIVPPATPASRRVS